MSDNRSLVIIEDEVDVDKLISNGWSLMVVKAVEKDGGAQPTMNIVWKTDKPVYQTTIEWKPIYALNWTASPPAAGKVVTYQGEWKQADIGTVWELNANGFFDTPSSSSRIRSVDPDFINISKNLFKPEDTDGPHIIVGIQNDSGSFDPIFVDTVALPLNASAAYQPQEVLEWWYDVGLETGTMIDMHTTSIGSGDFSKPEPETGKYLLYTSYSYSTGDWTTSQNPISLGNVEIKWPFSTNIFFKPSINTKVRGQFKAFMEKELKFKYGYVKVTWNVEVEAELGVTLSDPKAEREEGDPVTFTDAQVDITKVIKSAEEKQIIPPKESWVYEK